MTMVQMWRNTARALIDRRGITALEYVVLMAAMIPAVIIGAKALGVRVGELIDTVVF